MRGSDDSATAASIGGRAIRVGIIVPMTLVGVGDAPLRDLLELYDRNRDADTELRVYRVTRGPATIESLYDEQLSGAFCLPLAEAAERDGMDVIINSCFGDPGLQAIQEAVSIPVVGTGQASLFFASMLGETFSVIVTDAGAEPMVRRQLRDCGLSGRVASVRNLGSSVGQVLAGTSGGRAGLGRVKELVRGVALKTVTDDGAEAVVLACGGLGLAGLSQWLEEEIGVPVLDSNVLALRLAELMVKCGLRHSKRSHPTPAAKPRTW